MSAYAYLAAFGVRSGIAILYASGHQMRVIETEPYKPSQVCFAPDHSLWMFGDQWKSGDTPVPDFMAFRHYSRDGKLLGSYVPRSALPRWQGFGEDKVLGPVVGHARLRASRERIGAALRVGPLTQTWVELNLDGQLVGQWTFDTRGHEGVTPWAFDEDGKLYGQRFVDHERAGLSIFEKSDGSWKPISSPSDEHLLGSDGVWLVFQKGDVLEWMDPSKPESAESAAVTRH